MQKIRLIIYVILPAAAAMLFACMGSYGKLISNPAVPWINISDKSCRPDFSIITAAGPGCRMRWWALTTHTGSMTGSGSR
jgi:hypothetical protein